MDGTASNENAKSREGRLWRDSRVFSTYLHTYRLSARPIAYYARYHVVGRAAAFHPAHNYDFPPVSPTKPAFSCEDMLHEGQLLALKRSYWWNRGQRGIENLIFVITIGGAIIELH